MDKDPWFRVLSPALIACLLASGCVSVDIDRSKLPDPKPSTGTLEVSIFETAADVRRDAFSPRSIVAELVRSDVKPEQMVYRGWDSRWTREGLPPGRYRLTAVAVLDEQGKESPLANQDSERFRIHSGEKVRATIVVKKVPAGAIGGISAGLLAVIGAAIIISGLAFFAGGDEEPTVAPHPDEGRRRPGGPLARPLSRSSR